MPVNSASPDVSVLKQLALGQMPPQEVERLAQHCEQYPRCIQVLHSIKAEDALIGTMAAQGTAPDQSRDAVVNALIERLKQLPSPVSAEGEMTDTVYRLATGQLPFRGDNMMSVLTSVALDTPKPPREINADIPLRMASLIERLLSKDREQRPKTAKVVADELAAVEREATQPAANDRTVQVAACGLGGPRPLQPSPSGRSGRRRSRQDVA